MCALDVSLRLARVSALTPVLTKRYRAELSGAERQALLARPAPLQPAALLARALMRLELAAALDCDPGALIFSAGARGKPALAGKLPLVFNLSHSGDWVALVHARVDAPTVALGVDVEASAPERDVLRLARRFFAAHESEALAGEQDPRQRERAFRALWTLKEAWVKAHGGALAPGLGAAAFALDERAGRIRVGAGTDGHFLAFEPVPALAAALCVLGAGAPETVHCYEGLPLAGWQPLPHAAVLRGGNS